MADATVTIPVTVAAGVPVDTVTMADGDHRQVVAIGDPGTDGNKATVFVGGQLRIVADPSQLFLDTFDSGLDTVNRWQVPLTGGTGIAATSTVGATVLDGGTTANSFSVLESRPSFIPDEPGFDLLAMRLNIEFPVVTTAYRAWGLGTTPGSPTIAVPLNNFTGWEIRTDGKLYATTWASGGRNFSADLSSSGNSKQPGDSSAHKYYTWVRGDLTYWAIDSLDNIVASFVTGASGPDVNTLPIKLLVVSNGGTHATIQLNGLSLGDTSHNNIALSDPTYPWRQANVSAAGALSVAQQGAVTVVGITTGGTGGPILVAEDTAAAILLELKRMNTYLSFLTQERVSDADILEL
jgi:hypothetical protein